MISRLRELSQYRELVHNLVIRDLKVRYKGSIFGFFWSFLNPLLMMLVLTFVFTIIMPNPNIRNFPIFLLCGLLPWNFFTSAINSSVTSIVGNAPLVKKVYFPREVLPISMVLSNLVNFLLTLVVLFVIIALFRARITVWVLMLPLVVLIQVMFTLGISFILSTLNVFYRDTAVIINVVLMAWFFFTPIFYPINVIGQTKVILGYQVDAHRLLRILNPMASLVASYRDILYWGSPTGLDFLFRTFVTALGIMIFGYWVFCRYSAIFSEEI